MTTRPGLCSLRVVSPRVESTRELLVSSMSCHMRRLVSGSRPVVGSSRKMTAGPPTRAMPSETRRFWPPESVFTSASSLSPRFTAMATSSATFLMRWLGTPRTLA
mmetsp:Transcript_24589/g.66882  ORF Transcript_24589/g.66882 Transcript_24589/m.66882 type:complete len:105 (+) Transcript_24589:325-639(+)